MGKQFVCFFFSPEHINTSERTPPCKAEKRKKFEQLAGSICLPTDSILFRDYSLLFHLDSSESGSFCRLQVKWVTWSPIHEFWSLWHKPARHLQLVQQQQQLFMSSAHRELVYSEQMNKAMRTHKQQQSRVKVRMDKKVSAGSPYVVLDLVWFVCNGKHTWRIGLRNEWIHYFSWKLHFLQIFRLF